jgi:RHS repeat-associated protein
MPTTVTYPAPLGAVTNAYDDASRLMTSTDGKGQVTDYYYDDNDRLVEINKGINCASKCVSYDYDGRGNLLERKDDSGITTYTWDAQNRPTSKTAGGVTTSVTYDAASNVTSFTDPTGTVTYAYDAANRLVSLAEPGGSCLGTPVFPNSTKCTGFGYDNADRRTTTTYPNGVKNTTVYDGAGRTTSITATNTGGTVLTRRAYTFTTNGTKDGALRQTVTDQAGAVTTYGYDEINRLKSAFITGSSSLDIWSYDKNGNRTSEGKSGTSAGGVYHAYNAADQLCWTGSGSGTCATPPPGATTYTHDANGNTTAAGTTTQTYNVFDQFTANTSGGVTTNYTYTGPRNDERLTAGATAFLNGSLGTTRQTTAGATTSFIRDPDGTLISMRTSTGASYYYTTDALGSVILLTDGAQTPAATYAYDPWGVATTATGAPAAVNPWTYAGGYNDTTSNTIKFGARYYNPSLGRFTQPDPSGQEQNRYAYVQCNPVNRIDPSGLYSWGEAADDCARGAVTNAAISIGVGAVTGGWGVVGALGAGCLGNVAGGYLADSLTASPQAEDQVGGGINYLQWLSDVARVVSAF